MLLFDVGLLLKESDPFSETEVLLVKLVVLDFKSLELAKGLVLEVLDLLHELASEFFPDLGLEFLLRLRQLCLCFLQFLLYQPQLLLMLFHHLHHHRLMLLLHLLLRPPHRLLQLLLLVLHQLVVLLLQLLNSVLEHPLQVL